MKAGQLDRRLRILKPGLPVDDGYGERDGGFVTLADVWARFLPGKGSERREMAATEAVVPVTWIIRWSPTVRAVDPTHRVVALKNGLPAGPVFDVKSVVEVGRREGVQIEAIARAERS